MAQKRRNNVTRMTTHIRERLLKDLITRTFHDRAQEMTQERADFARRVYKESFSEKDHKLMASLPKGWLPTDNDIKVQIAHAVQQFHFNGGDKYSSLSEEFRLAGAERIEDDHLIVPWNKYNGSPVIKVFDADSDIRKAHDDLTNRYEALIEEIKQARTATKKVLESVGSIKKLIEVWPEVEAFAKPYLTEGERRAILPMIPREKINAMLGLPPSASENVQ